MSDTNADAIDDILKVRDQLVVMRERLFQLTAATAARTKKVDGVLMDCATAGRVFGARIGLPEWDNVLAMPAISTFPRLMRNYNSKWEECARTSIGKAEQPRPDRQGLRRLFMRD